MTKPYRTVITAVLLAALAVLAIPAQADPPQQGSGPRMITGSYQTTNPIYPTIGAETGVMLYDLTGQVLMDFDFRAEADTQVIGTLNGDIVSGTYSITLPDTPNGIVHDFDGDPASAPAVQVFAAATYVNFLGDEYINRGESPLDMSARLDPVTFEVIGGNVLVWAAQDGEQFPASLGTDGAAFTDDDTTLPLPAGWSVVSLDTEPFTILRDETLDVPIIESLGGLNDYSSLDYLEAWETLFARTRETYPFTSEKSLDWDAIYAEITPMVQIAAEDIDFHLIMARFGELIGDTHIGFVSMPVLQQYLMGGLGIGGLAVTDDNEVVIGNIAAASVAERSGIKAGDVLVMVDNQPALQVLDSTPLLINSASTTHGRRFLQAATMLQGPVGSSVALTWRAQDGTEKTETLTRSWDVTSIMTAFGGALEGDVISARMLDTGIGYIRIRGFASEVSQADELFAGELQNLIDQGAQGIILDVRDNGGGLVQLAMSMAGRFLPDYAPVLDFYYADGEGGFAYRGFVETLMGEPAYDGPVAILVNEMTGSAGEIFVYALSHPGRAVVVGHTPTGGFTGEVGDGQYLLPGSLQTQFPTGRPLDPVTGETLIEGTGVIPDIRVPLTRESMLSPEDEVLQAAEAALLGQ
ncbi:MAG: PDZ domain-containing protein [Chloroflexi bacterium]|nr:PDZ domain-containing protein [Chloroflexota bacterium]